MTMMYCDDDDDDDDENDWFVDIIVIIVRWLRYVVIVQGCICNMCVVFSVRRNKQHHNS